MSKKNKKNKLKKVTTLQPLQEQKPETVAPQSPMNAEGLIAQAITKGVPVETMERLLAMRRELRAEQAKEEFDKAMAAFQAECPPIKKTKAVYTNSGAVAYKFAPIDSIVTQVKPLIQKHGFSYSSNMEILSNGTTQIKVLLKVTHAAGHSETTEMTVPLGGKTNIMNDSQVVAAAQTFARRYAFTNAFGILTSDEDTDAAYKDSEKKEKELSKEIVDKINAAKTLESLVETCKQIKPNLHKDLQDALVAHYTRRKKEIENELKHAQ